MKQPQKRAQILLAVALLLYACGYVTQFIGNYAVWQKNGGMLGGTSPPFPSLSPLTCLKGVLWFPYNLYCMAGCAAAVAVIFLYRKLFSQDALTDSERNFDFSAKGTYGTSGWMQTREVPAVLDMVSDLSQHTGTVLGMLDGKFLCIPEKTRMNGKAAATTAATKTTPGNTFAGGLSGMVSRHVQQSTASSISGQSGGIGASLGGAMYHNSLGKDGGFASKVIGSIATGQTSGNITGDSAVEALNGYFAGTSDMDAMQIPATGENIPTAMATAESDAVTDSPIPATPLALEGDSTVDVSPTRDSEIAMRAGGGSAVVDQSTIPTSSSIQQAAMNRVLLGQMGNSVTDVEIGGGKIQGREIIPGRGQIQFAMYNARQYEKPEGHFTEQTSRDGEKWYKVYATTRVEKTPTVQDERGRMQYDERKVAAMPKAPARRH